MYRGREREEEEPLKKTVRQDENRLASGRGAGAGHSALGTRMGWDMGAPKWGALGKSFFLWSGTGEAEWGAVGPHAAVVGDQLLSGVCILAPSWDAAGDGLLGITAPGGICRG